MHDLVVEIQNGAIMKQLHLLHIPLMDHKPQVLLKRIPDYVADFQGYFVEGFKFNR